MLVFLVSLPLRKGGEKEGGAYQKRTLTWALIQGIDVL